jgi:CHAT domain-containing protein
MQLLAHEHTKHFTMKHFIAQHVGIFCISFALGVSSPVRAQTDEIESGFRKMDVAQEQKLRSVLLAPVPLGAAQDVLARHFAEKDRAAVRLSDPAARIALLRDATKLLPDAVYKSNLARALLSDGQIEEGNAWSRQAIDTADPLRATFFSALAACDLVDQYKNALARTALEEVAARVKAAEPKATGNPSRGMLARAQGRAAICSSTLESRLGKYALAIAAAESAETQLRRASSLLANTVDKTYVMIDVASAIARKLQAYRAGGRLQDAEKTLADYIRYSREVELPPVYLSGIYATASNLRFAQREFAQAEQLIRKSDEVLEKLNYDPVSGVRVTRARDAVMALVGQKKWPQALQEIERLDSLAGQSSVLRARVLLRFERAVVNFGNARYAQAAPLFERVALANAALFGNNHFFTAQSQGLQGAALWRTSQPSNMAKAMPLLKAAVRDYMAPTNTDYLENIGIRKDLRDMVFAAYLDAVTTTAGEDATQAMGPADWVRSSSVQDSLADAAVRAAVNTPALAAVVRQEQDAKNESAGLRRYLSGEAGGAASPLPEIASQMRARVAELETQRQRLQAEIKAKFPDYDNLVRPAPPSVQTIAQQLDASQALVLLLPTVDAVYVWAVAQDRPAKFARVTMAEDEVNAAVTRLRKDLDFAGMRRAPKTYDSATAFALYDKLLAPVAGAWQGKPQLIVAAAGMLSQLPFAVLHTAPGGDAGANAPWLIAQTAITQVPSLSAWLAIKNIAKSPSARDAFIGWGDPLFSSQTSAAAPAAVARNVVLQRSSSLANLDAGDTTETPAALRYGDMPALPDTRDELQAIAQILSANAQTDVILGANATRASVMAASANGNLARKRVVAFATHGLMAGDFPNLTQPALAMTVTPGAGNNPLEPLLTLEDVLTLKLNADWVVLSACNTAAPDGKGEEALSGLARGFFYAGSRSLLVTHWSVESESATQLTSATFAHYVANPKSPKAESLRQAMLQVMSVRRFAHPAYWAPYALVGDGGR